MERVRKLFNLRTWLARLILLARLRAFDTTTEDGRKNERSRRIALSAAGDGASRVVRIVISLVSIPLTLHHLGDERYGIWIAISSMVSMAGIADFGIGNGLISALAKRRGQADEPDAAKYVSSAFFGLSGIAILLGIVFISAIKFIPWDWLFNVSSRDLLAEVRSAATVVVIFYLLRFPLSIAEGIRRAYQEGYIASILDICSSLVSLIGLLIVIHLGLGLTWLVAVLAGAPIIGALLNAGLIVWRDHPHLAPRMGNFERPITFSLLRVGWCFLGLQACTMVAYETDVLIVSRMLGVGEVPQYSVPLRLFMVFPMVLTFVLRPLWPAYAEASASGDHNWVRTTLWRSVLMGSAISAIGALFLGTLGNFILKIWIGQGFEMDLSQRISLSIYIILASTINAFTRFFQGIEALRFLLITMGLMAIANFPISLMLTHVLGVSGPIWGTVIAWFVFSLLPMIYYSMKRFKHSGNS